MPQQMHKHTGGPLHIPSLTMETPEQHSIVMDIRDLCVCVKTVEGDGRRWGAAVNMLKTPWLFGLAVSTFPLQSQGDCAAQTVKAMLLIASAEIQEYHPFIIPHHPVRTLLTGNGK